MRLYIFGKKILTINHMIPNTFIETAGDILGHTDFGLSGSEIASKMLAYAYDFNKEIPFPKSPYPAEVPNKRHALKRNLEAFEPEQQFKIINELCALEKFKGNQSVKDLKIKLITRYGNLNTDYDVVNQILIDETKHWLYGYDDALKVYESSLEKFKNGIFERNLLDDLRLSLELLIKKILNNNKSIENQIGELGNFIKTNNGSKELGNMFQKLVEYFTKYENTYVKHSDTVIEEEVEFILEITSSFMKHFIRMNKS